MWVGPPNKEYIKKRKVFEKKKNICTVGAIQSINSYRYDHWLTLKTKFHTTFLDSLSKLTAILEIIFNIQNNGLKQERQPPWILYTPFYETLADIIIISGNGALPPPNAILNISSSL